MTRFLWSLARGSLIVVCLTAAAAVSDTDLGFLWICSVRAADHQGDPQKLIGHVVIGVYPVNHKRHESFAITDGSGYTMVPLRPGKYCAEALDSHGRKLRLDENTNGGRAICFDITAHKITEAGLTISHDVNYKPDFPSKGVD